MHIRVMQAYDRISFLLYFPLFTRAAYNEHQLSAKKVENNMHSISIFYWNPFLKSRLILSLELNTAIIWEMLLPIAVVIAIDYFS